MAACRTALSFNCCSLRVWADIGRGILYATLVGCYGLLEINYWIQWIKKKNKEYGKYQPSFFDLL